MFPGISLTEGEWNPKEVAQYRSHAIKICFLINISGKNTKTFLNLTYFSPVVHRNKSLLFRTNSKGFNEKLWQIGLIFTLLLLQVWAVEHLKGEMEFQCFPSYRLDWNLCFSKLLGWCWVQLRIEKDYSKQPDQYVVCVCNFGLFQYKCPLSCVIE